MRKLSALLLVLAMCVSLFGCSSAKPVEITAPATEVTVAEATAATEDIVILYTNDVHTYIDGAMGYDVIAALKESLKNVYGNVLLVDAGDAVQGTAFGSMDKGETIIKLMNAAGYDLATLGNHEFDYGMSGTMNIISWAEYPYVSSTFHHEKDGVMGETVLPAYKMFEIGGRKLAIVGATTPEALAKSSPGNFQDGKGNYIYGIAGGEDGAELYAAVQSAIDAAKAEGAQMVIGLGHLGDDLASGLWTSEETIAHVTGLDAFIDGHSHATVKGKDINGTWLTQTGEHFNAIGMMLIDGETGEISTDLIGYEEILETQKDDKGKAVLDAEGKEVTDVVGYKFVSDFELGTQWASDEVVAAIQSAWITEVDTMLSEVIGFAEVTFDNYDANGTRLVRMQETNSGDFTADALYYLFDNMDMDVDVAIMNGGGIRNATLTGDLTYKVAKNIQPYSNVACLQTVTGQQLLDALEWGSRGIGTGEEINGFLHVAGVTFKVDDRWPSSVQMDNKGVWIGAPTGGYRVHDVQVYNKETDAYEALDLTASYNLAGYNQMLQNLGDGFNMFHGSVNVMEDIMEDYMVLANYITGFEGGVVKATNSPLAVKYPGMLLDYSTVNGSGRIVVEAVN